MTNPNQHPASPERQTFLHQEMIQFNDGSLALGYSTPGDKLDLGHDSKQKYARSFDTIDMALISTKSGNTYGIARGLVINKNQQRAFRLPEETIRVTIGEYCLIPGVGSTSDVESVMLRYKIADPGYEHADRQMDTPSPFKALQEQIDRVYQDHKL